MHKVRREEIPTRANLSYFKGNELKIKNSVFGKLKGLKGLRRETLARKASPGSQIR
jgi:hypothetical protein